MSENRFQIDLRHHYLSMKAWRLWLLLMFFLFVLFGIPETELERARYIEGIIIPAIFFFITFSPALYLHITYAIQNRGLILIVDRASGRIRILRHNKAVD